MKINFPTEPKKLARTGTMIELPKLEISIHGPQQVYRKHVLVDTGAFVTLFPLGLAAQIGIADVEQLPATSIKTGSGEKLKGHVARVKFTVNDPFNSRRGFDWDTEIVLAEANTYYYGVLGHQGFLEFFEFTLRAGVFQISEKADFPGTVRDYP